MQKLEFRCNKANTPGGGRKLRKTFLFGPARDSRAEFFLAAGVLIESNDFKSIKRAAKETARRCDRAFVFRSPSGRGAVKTLAIPLADRWAAQQISPRNSGISF